MDDDFGFGSSSGASRRCVLCRSWKQAVLVLCASLNLMVSLFVAALVAREQELVVSVAKRGAGKSTAHRDRRMTTTATTSSVEVAASRPKAQARWTLMMQMIWALEVVVALLQPNLPLLRLRTMALLERKERAAREAAFNPWAFPNQFLEVSSRWVRKEGFPSRSSSLLLSP
jgi:hypothetical protein